jgi:hypothetical protein
MVNQVCDPTPSRTGVSAHCQQFSIRDGWSWEKEQHGQNMNLQCWISNDHWRRISKGWSQAIYSVKKKQFSQKPSLRYTQNVEWQIHYTILMRSWTVGKRMPQDCRDGAATQHQTPVRWSEHWTTTDMTSPSSPRSPWQATSTYVRVLWWTMSAGLSKFRFLTKIYIFRNFRYMS